ncbi:carotenoid biosynthesis protein [Paenibacillus frigoriresistens]|uniref:carotenoid biosynthesis protein n=1 Tax=Paenibacillus alginolyticus TaxID=59839 RepID=UPI001565FA1D|nr:carotenoid biosynthesis protein [Paenibacillus frigoriresistens]NRF91959.1 carotenoid biosynthesis protein [Paenibacillus frigoriresistens]
MIRLVFIVWYLVGLLLMLTIGVPNWLSFSNGLFLVFFALYASSLETRLGEKPIVSWARIIFIGAMTFLIEEVGVRTGWPFGKYSYTDVLGVSLGHVPLAIPCAWIGILIAVVNMITTTNRWLRALYMGTWTVIFDMVLDPVAFARQFWVWQEQGDFYGIPATNFVSWFVLAALISLLFPKQRPSKYIQREAVRLVQAMLLMFGLLGTKEGLWIPLLIAVAGIVLAQGGIRVDRIRYKQMV